MHIFKALGMIETDIVENSKYCTNVCKNHSRTFDAKFHMINVLLVEHVLNTCYWNVFGVHR